MCFNVFFCILFFVCPFIVSSFNAKAIIYIGPYKTGSSTVAKHLYDNSDKLKQDNIYLPESICHNSKLDAGFITCIDASGHTKRSDGHCSISCDEIKKFVSQHKKENHTIIFGHESFSNHMSQGFLELLLDTVSGYDVWFVSFYRPLTSRLFSYQEQQHAHDTNLTFVYFDKYYDHLKESGYSYFDLFFLTNMRNALMNIKSEDDIHHKKSNHRLFLIDFSNALISHHMEPHQVIHCDILQLCPNVKSKDIVNQEHVSSYKTYDHTLHSTPASLKANGHKDRFGDNDQLFYNFRVYVESRNCTLLNSATYYVGQSKYWQLFHRHNNIQETSSSKSDIITPYIQTTYEAAKREALETHKWLYAFGTTPNEVVTWLYPNETLSLHTIENFEYQEIDRNEFFTNKMYRRAFSEMLKYGLKKKEIEC